MNAASLKQFMARAIIAPLVLMTFMLAGCTASGPSEALGSIEGEANMEDFFTGLVVGEPHVLPIDDDKWLIDGIDSQGNGYLSLTKDGGKTWSQLDIPDPGRGSQDLSTAVDSQGRIWVASLPMRNTEPPFQSGSYCTVVGWIDLEGTVGMVDANSCLLPTTERPWLSPIGQGVALAQFENRLVQPLLVVRAHTGEGGWELLGQPLPNVGMISPLATCGERLAILTSPAIDVTVNSNRGLYLREWDGETWSNEMISEDFIGVRWPALACDANRLVAVWGTSPPDSTSIGGRAGAMTIHMAMRVDGVWQETKPLSTGTAAMPWASSDPNGIAITWLQANSTEHPEEVPEDTEWSMQVWHDGETATVATMDQRGPICVLALQNPCDTTAARTMGEFLGTAIHGDSILAPIPRIENPDDLFQHEIWLRVWMRPV